MQLKKGLHTNLKESCKGVERIMRAHIVAQREIAESLASSADMLEAGVTIIEQNARDLITQINQAESAAKGPVVIVGTEKVVGKTFTVRELDMVLNIREKVAVNRTKQFFMTAMDVADEAVNLINGHTWRFLDFVQVADNNGILETNVRFRGLVEVSTDNIEDE